MDRCAEGQGRAEAAPGRAVSLAGAVLALAGLACAIHLLAAPNHDVAWLLTGAERLLDGGRFGRDVVDVNPPLAWWVLAAPVAAAEALGIGPWAPAVIFLAGLCLASVALTGGFCRNAGVLAAAAAILLLAPGYDFGQREHLMLMAALPYAAAVAARAAGAPGPPALAVLAGVAGGVGFCLKPHFLLLPVLLEAWALWRTRSLRRSIAPETLALAAVGLAYAAALALWAPDYLATVAVEAMATYGAYEASLGHAALMILQAAAPGLAGLACLALAKRPPPPLAQALLVASLAAAAAALLQRKGWAYHALPLLGLTLAASAAWLAAAEAAMPRLHKAAVMLFLAIGVLQASASQGRALALGLGSEGDVPRLARLFRAQAGPGEAVFAFITSPRDIHPAVLLSGVRWSSAACCLHHLPAAARLAGELRPDAQAAAIRRASAAQLAAVRGELERARPALILVDARPTKLGFRGAFDYLAYLDAEPGFRALFAGYEEIAPVAGFRVLRRRDGPPAEAR